MDTNDHPEQAADENRAPGQKTPSRGYGRQVHKEDDAAKEAKQAESTPTHKNAQKSGDDQQKSGSPSA